MSGGGEQREVRSQGEKDRGRTNPEGVGGNMLDDGNIVEAVVLIELDKTLGNNLVVESNL